MAAVVLIAEEERDDAGRGGGEESLRGFHPGQRRAEVVRVGLGSAVGVSWLIRQLLFGIEPVSPAVYTGVAVMFAGVALLACLGPSLRASRIDPLVAIRNQ